MIAAMITSKVCMHFNKADMSNWLTLIYLTTEVALCFFDLDGERGEFFSLHWNKKKWASLCHMQPVACV